MLLQDGKHMSQAVEHMFQGEKRKFHALKHKNRYKNNHLLHKKRKIRKGFRKFLALLGVKDLEVKRIFAIFASAN